MKIWNVEQRRDEWFKLKSKYILSSSNAMHFDTYSKMETFIYNSFNEKKEIYVNEDMQRGIDLEPVARGIYGIMFSKVKEVGFITNERFPLCGCSPDGIAETKILEIKCPNNSNYARMLVEGKLPKNYELQVQFSMLIAELKEAVIMVYNPNFNQEYILKNIEFQEGIFEETIKFANELFNRIEGL